MKNILGENWLTNLGGLIAAIGGVMALLPKSLNLDPQWGAFAVGLGGAIAGFGAKSFNVHSTQNEVKVATEEKKNERIPQTLCVAHRLQHHRQLCDELDYMVADNYMGGDVMNEAALNTDKVIWRLDPGNYYSPSIHITKGNGIGINCNGHVLVAPIEAWHCAGNRVLAVDPALPKWRKRLAWWLLGGVRKRGRYEPKPNREPSDSSGTGAFP